MEIDLSGDVQADMTRPWGSNPISNMADVTLEAKSWFDDYLHDMELNLVIDEVALLFPHPFAMRDFVMDAVGEDGVELFNTAYDKVNTQPFNTSYEVEYAFLRTKLGMRVECMAIRNGFSPLHEALIKCNHMEDGFNPCVVHMSFKCNDFDQYVMVCHELKDEGHSQVQFCKSDYGIFSYFSSGNFPHSIYLKPRMNERDQTPNGPIKPGEAAENLGLTVVRD